MFTDLRGGCTASTAITDDNNSTDNITINSDSKVSRRRLDGPFFPDVTTAFPSSFSNKASLSETDLEFEFEHVSILN